MKKQILFVVGCWCLVGCSSSTDLPGVGSAASKTAAASTKRSLCPAPDVALAALLDRPRVELAALAADWEAKIAALEQLRQQGKIHFELLPETRLPLAPPIWREAKFSASRGFSVPPYLQEGVKDTALALHLARHGDVEAALLLVEPGAEAEVRGFKLERNFPAEWSRLVGLMLHHAQFTLATGNLDGADLLLALHQQVRSLLPATAAQDALGQALLPRGLDTLALAASRWRTDKQDGLAQAAEAFLKEMGAAPVWQWRLPTEQTVLTKQLGLTGDGRALPAGDPMRALDLVALPAPHAHAEACWAFFGQDRRLCELLVVYRPSQLEYHEAQQWIPQLDTLPKSQPAVTAMLTMGNPHVGGLIRFQFGTAPAQELPRDFGIVHLDRTFEANRRTLAWKQHGAPVQVKDAKILSDVRTTLPAAVASATLEREPNVDLTTRARFTLSADVKQTLCSLAQPLWLRHGLAKIETDAGVALVWEDGATRLTLRLPHDKNEPPLLEASDISGQDAAKRLTSAQARNQKDRQTRLEKNQPFARLPRALETLTLGMKRRDVERLLPGGPSAVRHTFPRGLMATYPGQPQGTGDAVVRTIVARFDAADQLAELRVRYSDYPGSKQGTVRKKLDALQAAHGTGAATALSAALTVELPTRKGGAGQSYRWHDDLTLAWATLDSGSLEVVLRDCPRAHPGGEPLPTLACLPRGPERVFLGAKKDSLVAQGAQPHEGALLIKPPSASPYDMILVWCEQDVATRIVARHRVEVGKERGKTLAETWSREVEALGWPWRQDFAGNVPQGWTTHDERTRYRMFWQDDNLGTHLLSEWRALQ